MVLATLTTLSPFHQLGMISLSLLVGSILTTSYGWSTVQILTATLSIVASVFVTDYLQRLLHSIERMADGADEIRGQIASLKRHLPSSGSPGPFATYLEILKPMLSKFFSDHWLPEVMKLFTPAPASPSPSPDFCNCPPFISGPPHPIFARNDNEISREKPSEESPATISPNCRIVPELAAIIRDDSFADLIRNIKHDLNIARNNEDPGEKPNEEPSASAPSPNTTPSFSAIPSSQVNTHDNISKPLIHKYAAPALLTLLKEHPDEMASLVFIYFANMLGRDLTNIPEEMHEEMVKSLSKVLQDHDGMIETIVKTLTEMERDQVFVMLRDIVLKISQTCPKIASFLGLDVSDH
jgi:hypothetical protein